MAESNLALILAPLLSPSHTTARVGHRAPTVSVRRRAEAVGEGAVLYQYKMANFSAISKQGAKRLNWIWHLINFVRHLAKGAPRQGARERRRAGGASTHFVTSAARPSPALQRHEMAINLALRTASYSGEF